MFARVREFALEMNSARCHRAIVPLGQRRVVRLSRVEKRFIRE